MHSCSAMMQTLRHQNGNSTVKEQACIILQFKLMTTTLDLHNNNNKAMAE